MREGGRQTVRVEPPGTSSGWGGRHGVGRETVRVESTGTSPAGGGSSAVGAVGVVVPAHDEEALLGRCLAGLRAAAAHPDLVAVEVRVVVVLDACTDTTGQVALAAGVRRVAVDARCVGAARAAGTDAVLTVLAGSEAGSGGAGRADLDRTWVATTDADSVVAPDWLAQQVRLAAAGADAVVGVVEVDLSGGPAGLDERYAALYGDVADGHRHVHGASLGVRASAYREVGGFAPLPVSEDVALVAALRAAGRRVVPSAAVRVTTSPRLEPRARGGFGDLLRSLAA